MKVTQLLLLVALVAFAPAAVFAMQDQPPLETNAGTTFFQDAGSIGIVIIVLSVVALTMIIKEVMAIRRDQLAPPELIDEIEALFEAGEYQEAIELCETESCYFTNIVASGLPKLNASFDAMEKALEEMIEEETIKLHARLSWLSLIAGVAPMLGLMGTVNGMIGAFEVIAASKGQATPDKLAGDISQALITTLLGLVVAVPVTAAFVFLRNRVVSYSLEVAAVVEDLFERFRPRAS
ncbi:MAG: MotA/TolQ/ExbB proton channel family protein [Planctomycetota bacterium]|jgi:biopolymer transport protein ExbB|nr:MotA/TolQ/ExbB proton channel family protein [Planctomycetota bacterium]